MRGRRPNPKLVKIHRTYTVEEAAKVCGVHRNTVRQWLKNGLPCIDQQRPTLILGRQLGQFVRDKRAEKRRPCSAGEIYCVRCRDPQVPANLQVTYSPLTVTQGNLIGLCPMCGSRMFRRVSLAKLATACGPLRIAMPEALDHIDESPQPSENSDFR